VFFNFASCDAFSFVTHMFSFNFDIWAWAFGLKCLPLKVPALYIDLEPCFSCAEFDANVGGV
jgi:hypothetical protein